jgi:hypothetical protein
MDIRDINNGLYYGATFTNGDDTSTLFVVVGDRQYDNVIPESALLTAFQAIADSGLTWVSTQRYERAVTEL